MPPPQAPRVPRRTVRSRDTGGGLADLSQMMPYLLMQNMQRAMNRPFELEDRQWRSQEAAAARHFQGQQQTERLEQDAHWNQVVETRYREDRAYRQKRDEVVDLQHAQARANNGMAVLRQQAIEGNWSPARSHQAFNKLIEGPTYNDIEKAEMRRNYALGGLEPSTQLQMQRFWANNPELAQLSMYGDQAEFDTQLVKTIMTSPHLFPDDNTARIFNDLAARWIDDPGAADLRTRLREGLGENGIEAWERRILDFEAGTSQTAENKRAATLSQSNYEAGHQARMARTAAEIRATTVAPERIYGTAVDDAGKNVFFEGTVSIIPRAEGGLTRQVVWEDLPRPDIAERVTEFGDQTAVNVYYQQLRNLAVRGAGESISVATDPDAIEFTGGGGSDFSRIAEDAFLGPILPVNSPDAVWTGQAGDAEGPSTEAGSLNRSAVYASYGDQDRDWSPGEPHPTREGEGARAKALRDLNDQVAQGSDEQLGVQAVQQFLVDPDRNVNALNIAAVKEILKPDSRLYDEDADPIAKADALALRNDILDSFVDLKGENLPTTPPPVDTSAMRDVGRGLAPRLSRMEQQAREVDPVLTAGLQQMAPEERQRRLDEIAVQAGLTPQGSPLVQLPGMTEPTGGTPPTPFNLPRSGAGLARDVQRSISGVPGQGLTTDALRGLLIPQSRGNQLQPTHPFFYSLNPFKSHWDYTKDNPDPRYRPEFAPPTAAQRAYQEDPIATGKTQHLRSPDVDLRRRAAKRREFTESIERTMNTPLRGRVTKAYDFPNVRRRFGAGVRLPRNSR